MNLAFPLPWRTFKRVSTADTNGAVIKDAPGKVGFIAVYNINAAARYLKLYNLAAAPNVGVDVPDLTFLIPGNTTGGGNNLAPTHGFIFNVGVAMALTTGLADNNAGAVAASEIVVNIGFR